MKLWFSQAAVDDLARLRAFIAEHSAESAQRVSQRLIGAIQKLRHAPQIGRPVTDLPGEIREMPFGHYIVRYALLAPAGANSEGAIYILRIWHGKVDRVNQ